MNTSDPSDLDEIAVFGTGVPDTDVTNVQEAVDTFHKVYLIGMFSFLNGESGNPLSVIKISRSVEILGKGTTKPVIKDGVRPFHVVDPLASLSIENVHFKDSRGQAVYAQVGTNLSIIACKFENVIPASGITTIAIAIAGLTGTVSIERNEIDVGGTSANATNGILALNPGSPNIDISRNTIKNVSAHGIDIRNAPSNVRITGNTLAPGSVARSGLPGEFVDGIRCIGTGNYVVQGNTITIEFENAAGIRMGGTTAAFVNGNRIAMKLANPAGLQSGGIQVQGSCANNRVEANTITGAARVAMSAIHSDFAPDKPANSDGNPRQTYFWRNDHLSFGEAFADIEVGTGAEDTGIVAPIRTGLPQPVGSDARATRGDKSQVATGTAAKAAPTVEGTISNKGTRTTVEGNYMIIP